MPEFIAAIQRWEELGRQLDKTVQAYLDSCTALDLPISSYSSGAGDLISKIDDRLQRFDNSLTRRLSSARSSLACVRNKLAAPILRLPVEILSRIFHLVITISIVEIESPRHLSAEFITRTRYDTLYKLLSVCSGWQRVGVSQGTLWSLVPVVRHRDDRLVPAAAQLSFERASSCGLHLVAELPGIRERPDIQAFIEDSLTRYGPRIKSINFRTDYEGHLVRAVDRFLEATSTSPRSLHDLSLCYRQFGKSHERHHQSLFSPEYNKYASFNRMLESLRVLRLCQVNVNFRDVLLRHLTELKLQKITLGPTARLHEFFTALSSSPELRDIQMISVITYVIPSASPPSSDFQISLPVLRRLYLEDLYQDTLNCVLASITPGSHRIILHLTNYCGSTRHGVVSSSIIRVGLGGLRLQEFQIDTIILGPNFNQANWHEVLKRVPTATSLYLDSCSLSLERLLSIISPSDPNSGFPKLSKLHISRCSISVSNLTTLKALVTSYPLEELAIGVIVTGMGWGGREMYDLGWPSGQLNGFRIWLLDAVPRVVWLSGFKNTEAPIPEFESDVWQL
ncbi:hypothetical protein FRC11_006411 [Ceratobasidium sp. 423]|nr:hypothetical protein FRC11_006411 [Ceratobasidium sp. 423]